MSTTTAEEETPKKIQTVTDTVDDQEDVQVVNASGHKQELERNFGLISICATAITTGNTWAAAGGSIVCFRRLGHHEDVTD